MRALTVLIDPGQTFELRALPSGRSRICRGNDLPAAVEAAWQLSDEKGLYWCLNPVRHDLIGAASNKDVLCRRWLLIDVDSDRPADTNAVEAEKAAASSVLDAVTNHIDALGWPHPLIADSGNGFHAIYRIDLPNDKLAAQLVKAVLHKLAERFDTDKAKVDRSVHNSARIAKLPGSWARKGPHSDDRPHRMAKLLWQPESLDAVSVEQLQSFINGVPPVESNGTAEYAPRFILRPENSHKALAYLKRAVERECIKIALAPIGDRNNKVNEAAFALGQFASWPECNAADVKITIWQAATHAGLMENETQKTRDTMSRAWNDGANQPRSREKISPEFKIEPEKEFASLTEGLDEMKPEKVEWIWENRVATKFISIFAGRSGYGKSYVACALISALSRGDSPPYSSLRFPPMRTLFISEDPPKVVTAPRLLAMNANRPMIRFMKFEAMASYTLGNIDMLNAAYEECNRPKIIVIDPPANFLGSIDEHRNAEVRAVLKLLIIWIEKHNVACILISHINKQIGKGLDAVERIIGSVAWGSSARITVAFVKDPEDKTQFICGGTKNNLGPKAEPLAYRIGKSDNPESTWGELQWVGQMGIDMDDAINAMPKKSRGANAVEWLEGLFRQKREWESDDLRRMAREVGVTKYALFESAEVLALPIKKQKRVNASGEQYWVWIAQDNWPCDF
jgi:hypothetical protein